MSDEKKKIKQRMCVACGSMKNKSEMLRIVRDGNGNFVYDKTGKMNGRGAYVCDNEECLAVAFDKNKFDRSFKMHTGIKRSIIEETREGTSDEA